MIILNQIFDAPFIWFMVKLVLAMLLGLALGLERIYAHKTAGMRTYALVSMSSALFVLIAHEFASQFPGGGVSMDAILRMASQIIVGVGFLGTGLIIFKDGHIENLTTASGMWAAAGIGMAVGFGMFREAVFASLVTLFVLGTLSYVERSIRLKYFPDPAFEAEIKKEEAPKKPRKPRTRKIAVESVE